MFRSADEIALSSVEPEPFLDQEGVAVRGFLHQVPGAENGLVITHGAGGNVNAPLLRALASAFSASGISVLRCDLPFRQLRPYGPPSPSAAERDREGLRRAAEAMRKIGPRRVFLGGHSYGGRQASMLGAAESGAADGLLLLSYPLHPPKQPERLRTAHFPQLSIPALFVSGTRDVFGSPQELGLALHLIPGPTMLFQVEGVGHELLSKTNRESLPRTILTVFTNLFSIAR